MNDLEKKVLNVIDENWESEVHFLRGLIQRPSILGNEAVVQNFISRHLADMGLEVDHWEIDHGEISKEPYYSPVEWSYEGRPVVVSTWHAAEGGGRSLILNGHVDVVPVGAENQWSYDPWGGEVESGRMYGRGAGDMKAGVAAMIYAVKALKESGINLRGDVILETVIEEECTGNGTLATIARGYRGDAAIIPEPSKQAVLESHVGVMWVRVTVRGLGAHANSASDSANAILKACDLIRAVKELEEQVNVLEERPSLYKSLQHPLNYNVGTITAGDWTSSVPSECTFTVRISAFPGADLDQVQTQFKSFLLEAASKDEWLSKNLPEISFYAFRADGCTISRHQPIMATLNRSHQRVTGRDVEIHTETATSDMRVFNQYGIPATWYGPIAGNLHAPDEWVDLESLRETTKVLALAVMDWCGVSFKNY